MPIKNDLTVVYADGYSCLVQNKERSFGLIQMSNRYNHSQRYVLMWPEIANAIDDEKTSQSFY